MRLLGLWLVTTGAIWLNLACGNTKIALFCGGFCLTILALEVVGAIIRDTREEDER